MGLSQEDLGKRFSITQQAINKWESGKSSPDPEMITSLAIFFDISTDYLLGRIDNSTSFDSKRIIDKFSYKEKISPEDRQLMYDKLHRKGSYSPSAAVTPSLSPKEERDIAKDLEEMLDSLGSNEALAFDGEPLDDTTRELMRISLENSMRLSKQLAKKKFTPEKYK